MQEKKLNNATIGFMAGVALFFDTLKAIFDFIPYMGWLLVTPVFYLTFWLWFKMRGINFFTLKRAPTQVIGFVIEAIPGINILPAFTLIIMRVALDYKFKEEVTEKIVGNTARRLSGGNKQDLDKAA